MVLATLFFLYIKLIALKYKSDLLISFVVIVLWLLGGYINTRCAPVSPSTTSKQKAFYVLVPACPCLVSVQQ